VFAPVFCPNGVAAFGRDHESSRQVWSAQEGYPGDPAYREFYRDLGFDREMEYIRPFVSPDGARTYTGIKYHRVTGAVPLPQKEPYHPAAALARAEEHAANFVCNRERQAEHLRALLGRPPLVVSPYDTELFGHWWFEGPDFLEKAFRRMAQPGAGVRPVTLREYLEENTFHQVLRPNPSSWGDKGYYEVWLNASNDWAWRHIHQASIRMGELARENRRPDPLRRRVLNQAAREVLLVQASDWPFLLTMGTAVEYADHLERFRALEGMGEGPGGEGVDEGRLAAIEAQDNIFPDIDFSVFA
jgi:1,4-alpha-glucan branching enzyme